MFIECKYFKLPNEIFELNLKPSEFAVLCYLIRCSDDSGMCYPSTHTIAVHCSVSDNTVRKAIRLLIKRKIIRRAGGFSTSKFGRLCNSSYVYTVNEDFYTIDFCKKNFWSSTD